ncbi:MAG: cation transporter, partial [Anaerolineaceae bacterium]|nr:cation transporter [Anaerolineaceae bacterium]
MGPHNSQNIEKRFIISIALTGLIFLAELIGGFWTGSLSLLSDSAHVFMDVFALALSFLALRLSARPADDRHSFGWHRLEVFAALINGASLFIIAAGIWVETVRRFQQPQEIKGFEMLLIAAIGLIVNLVVAFVLNTHSHQHADGSSHKDLNVQSAFLHVIGDAISSVGVIVAAVIIQLTGAVWVDPLVSALIGGIIFFGAFRVLRSSLHILVEGVPEGLSIQKIGSQMKQVDGVEQVHDLHVWNICSGNIALSAHVVLQETSDRDHHIVMQEMKSILETGFGIEHTT